MAMRAGTCASRCGRWKQGAGSRPSPGWRAHEFEGVRGNAEPSKTAGDRCGACRKHGSASQRRKVRTHRGSLKSKACADGVARTGFSWNGHQVGIERCRRIRRTRIRNRL